MVIIESALSHRFFKDQISRSGIKINRIFSDNGIEYPLLVDYDRVFYSTYGIRVYPTTIIIDKDGKLSYSIPSHPLTYKKLLKGHIRKALGEIDEAGLKEALSTRMPKNFLV